VLLDDVCFYNSVANAIFEAVFSFLSYGKHASALVYAGLMVCAVLRFIFCLDDSESLPINASFVSWHSSKL